jgi:hypothetical protein
MSHSAVISGNDPLALRLDELDFSDLGDSYDDMKIRAKDKSFNFPTSTTAINKKLQGHTDPLPHLMFSCSIKKKASLQRPRG